MIVSWNWLTDFVELPADPAEAAQRLMMAGLNHESTERVDDDWAIDLEVTSNRPDCLGHVGIAREIAVLFGRQLRTPAAALSATGSSVAELARVRIDCPQLCYRYTARIIRGLRISPSPEWLVRRLRTLGLPAINNVVDVTNYVMMECGQPLHAFDLARLGGRQIIVREARAGEAFLAIDHRTYTLQPGMCVIADATSAVALGGVMGGAESEVLDSTTDILIEAAEFSPLSIRTTARTLGLHSPSSYRFERGVDPEGVDWASRRCCELILQLAGGELAEGVLDVGCPRSRPERITLRLAEVPRLLGISVPAKRVRQILADLGCAVERADEKEVQVVPPSWRRDLSREIDLIEEVARIHGYQNIPEDVAVPMCPSYTAPRDRIARKARQVLTATGFDEALTASLVPVEWSQAFSPWTSAAPVVSQLAMKGILSEAPKDLSAADHVRRSLVPSLLEARRYNESMSNAVIELFEVARIYLPQPAGLPQEQTTLTLVSGQDYAFAKGVVEQLLAALNIATELTVTSLSLPLLDAHKCSALSLDGRTLGYLGEVNAEGCKRFGLRAAATCAEINLDLLGQLANLTPQFAPISPCPSTARDLNLIVAESLRWTDLLATVRAAAGEDLEEVCFREIYRDTQKDGADQKRMLFSITLRSANRTLTGEEADAIRDRIVAACTANHGARLLG
jgi:phenylalanyl-tRNA synthetase beta chain